METIEERLKTKRDNLALYEQALGVAALAGCSGSRMERGQSLVLRLHLRDPRRRRASSGMHHRRHPGAAVVVSNHLQRPHRDRQSCSIERAPWFYDRLVNLPCSVSLTPEEITSIAEVIKATRP